MADTDLAQTLRAMGRGESGLRGWIAVLDQVFVALERAAWELRAAADASVASWQAAGASAASARAEAGRFLRRQERLGRSGWTLARVIAGYRLYGVYSAFLGAARRVDVLERLHRKSAQRFLATCVAHGGGFLKLGQMLSARPDLLPAAWVEELAQLQDDAPAEPFAAVRAVVEAELGAPLGELFARFDEQPLAAASIGQAHRALTHEGLEVVVKVQRPGVGELIELDLAVLESALAGLGGMLPPTDLETITAEVRAQVRRELDYRAELAAMQRMRALFADRPGVVVPRPIPELSTARVLTASYVAGDKITVALDRIAAAGDHQGVSTLLGALLDATLRQVLGAGFFQADPHPGNFLVTAAGELVLLDFGCVRELGDDVRRGYVSLLMAFLAGDKQAMAALFPRLGFATRSGGTETLEIMTAALLDRFRAAAARGSFTWPTRQEIFAQAAETLEASQRDPVVRIPAEFVMLGRVFATQAGLFQHYRPAIDYVRCVLPHLG